jgi:adenosine deaminase
MTNDLRSLPKAHLHIHLEAAMRQSTLAEWAAESGVPAPPVGEAGDFTEFSAKYLRLAALMTTPERAVRLIDEAVADAAADGAVIVELATTPTWYLPAFGDPDTAMDALIAAATEAGKRHGVWVGLIVAINRMGPVADGIELAELAARFAGRGVTGLGLHSDERGYPAADFTKAFAIARDAGLLAVPHAGELVGPESVRQAIDLLGADRVQHGVRAIEDPALVAELAERGITLDVCPTSNYLLGVVDDLAGHPLPRLLAAGVPCSLNADDPTLFGPSLLDEYQLCRITLGLDDDTLAACARTSVTASGAPGTVKDAALAGIDEWLRVG